MRKSLMLLAISFIGAGLACPGAGVRTSWAGANEETVASVNGVAITGLELREALGLWGGGVSAQSVPVAKKREALDGLIAARLLEQRARSKGFPGTEEFGARVKEAEKRVLIMALFRMEAASKVKVTRREVDATAKDIAKAGKGVSAENARIEATFMLWKSRMRESEEQLVAAAKQAVPVRIEESAMELVGKESIPDNAVLATVGDDRIRYEDVKRLLRNVPERMHGGKSVEENPSAVRNVLVRESTERSLLAYGRMRGVEDSAAARTVRMELERAILADTMTKEIHQGVKATDKEIRDAYERHSGMLVRDGKKVPLSEVQGEIRDIILREKRKKAFDDHVAGLRKKAKIRINEKLLPGI